MLARVGGAYFLSKNPGATDSFVASSNFKELSAVWEPFKALKTNDILGKNVNILMGNMIVVMDDKKQEEYSSEQKDTSS